jgi:hypothetical protein
MFSPGDKFIRYSKYGGVNIGIVADIRVIYGIDTVNKVTYEGLNIVTTNGVSYKLDGTDGRIFKISSEAPDEKYEKHFKAHEVFKKLAKEKRERNEKAVEKLKKNADGIDKKYLIP